MVTPGGVTSSPSFSAGVGISEERDSILPAGSPSWPPPSTSRETMLIASSSRVIPAAGRKDWKVRMVLLRTSLTLSMA